MTYTIDIQKDYPDGDNDQNSPKTVTMYTKDENDNLVQQDGPGLNPYGQIVYLQSKVLRTDLSDDEIEIANDQIDALTIFLDNNPTYKSDYIWPVETPIIIPTLPTTPVVDPVIDIPIIEIPKAPPVIDIPKAPAPIPPKGFLNTIKNIFS